MRLDVNRRLRQRPFDPRLTRVRWALLAIAVLAVYTACTWAFPDIRVSIFSPAARVALEVLTLCIALFAVLALLLPDDGDTETARNAFVAGLVTLGVSNVVFGVAPLVVGAASPFGGVYSFYPWLAARYIVGLLFIVAVLGGLGVSLRWYLAGVALLLAVADLGFLLLRDNLPQPFVELDFTAAGVAVPVSSFRQAALIAAVPALLFAVGAWLAAWVFVGGASVLYWWLALGLAVQGLSKVHEVLYPAVLGPRITSADLLRVPFLGLLLAGALLKVRQLVIDRGAAVRALSGDLKAQQELVAKARLSAAREEAFRSIVVHELATPIAALRTFAHVLTGGQGRGLETRLKTAAEGVRAESQRLQQLVGRMDELRGLELDEFHCELEPVPLRPLIDETARYVRGLPGGHEALVRWECREVSVQADTVRLGQALRNLVANAARFSPERSQIVLECGAERERVSVAVIDEGPGIPPDERDRVLGMFERGSAGRSADGAGVGLYVTSRIVQAHGGRLRIEDGGTAGTRVVIELLRAN